MSGNETRIHRTLPRQPFLEQQNAATVCNDADMPNYTLHHLACNIECIWLFNDAIVYGCFLCIYWSVARIKLTEDRQSVHHYLSTVELLMLK